MKRKISIMLSFLLSVGIFNTIVPKNLFVEARETQEKVVGPILVGTWKNTVEKKNAKASEWETFSTKYGSFDSTYEFNDLDFAGTLTATKIRVVPRESSLRKELVTNRFAKASDSLSQRYSERVSEPSFQDTINVTLTDPILGTSKTGSIGKKKDANGQNKAPTVTHGSETVPYVAWGGWPKAGDFYFRFLGNGSNTWQAAGQESFSFNAPAPPQSFLPYFRFYGDFNMIEDTSFMAMHNTEYNDPMSGGKKSGLEWSDDRQYTGNELVGKFFNTQNGMVSGYDLRDINGEKVFQKNSSGNYATLSRDFTKYTTVKDTPLRTGPSDYAPLVTEDGFNGIIPNGSYFEVTKGQSGYYYIAYYPPTSTYRDGSSVKVVPGSWGIGGWVKGTDMTVDITATGVPQGGNLNTHRKGTQMLYNLKQYNSVWTQEYEGNVALDDYNKEFYDEWDVYVIYEGTVQDIRLDNFVAESFKVSPTQTTLFQLPGQMPQVGDVSLAIEISHESYVNKSVKYQPLVTVSLNGVKLWEKNLEVYHNRTLTRIINISNVPISKGDNIFTVEINSDKKHIERHPTKDPYSDNRNSATHEGIELSTNNIVVSNLSVSPETAQVPPGEKSVTRTVKVKYDLSHEMNRSPEDSRFFSVPVRISMGDKVLWEGIETLNQRGKRTIEKEFSNLVINKGNNSIKVEANYSPRVITEVKLGVVNPYLDNIAETNLSIVDPYTNNFKINEAKVYPIRGIVNPEPGTNNLEQELTLIVEIEHELSSERGSAAMSPVLEIKIGGYYYSENVTMKQGEITTRTVTIPKLSFPVSGTSKTFPIEVSINMLNTIPEKINNVTDASVYKDNVAIVAFPVTKVPVCELPSSIDKRTVNTWSERWTKTEYKGVVERVSPNQICRLSSITVHETQQNYSEKYNLTNVYFRSKWTRDMHLDGKVGFNNLPERGIGWVRITPDSLVKIKSGYGFEIIATTSYETNRNRIVVDSGITYQSSSKGDNFSGPLGKGVCSFSHVTPSITPVNSPDILFVNIENGGGNVCSFLWKTEDLNNNWYKNEKLFELPLRSTINGAPERKIYTNENSKPGVYKVTLSTPRPDGANAFRGYEAETAISLINKGHLFDFVTFNLEIMSQDDIKSHISQ